MEGLYLHFQNTQVPDGNRHGPGHQQGTQDSCTFKGTDSGGLL